MKFRITEDDILAVVEKYSDNTATAGCAEDGGVMRFGYYTVILDDEKITLVKMNLSFEEIEHDVIPLSDVQSIKVSGFINKKVKIQTVDDTIKLIFKPLAVGNGAFQRAIVERFSTLAK